MKVLVCNKNFHPKNEKGLFLMLKKLNWEVRFQDTVSEESIQWAEIIYSPFTPLKKEAEANPEKLFFFGPHFGVFPSVLSEIETIATPWKNTFYIQPSAWVTNLFRKHVKGVEILQHPFAVDTDTWKPSGKKEDKILLYAKARNPHHIQAAREFLEKKGYTVLELNYSNRYSEEDYKKILDTVNGCLWVGCHESQGFAFQEALSMNVPLCVWNVKSLADQWEGGRPDIEATTCSYWDWICGEVFTEEKELEETWARYIERRKRGIYEPRAWIESKVGVEACAKRLEEMVYCFFRLMELRKPF